jgi:hypothetical protein
MNSCRRILSSPRTRLLPFGKLSRRPVTQGVRWFSSPIDKEEDAKALKGGSQSTLISRYGYPAAAAGGTIVAALLVYDLAYDFLVLTPAQSMYYGFMGGLFAAGIGGGVGYLGIRWSRLNPDRAISAAMKVLRSHPLAAEILGDGISSGTLRTYKIKRGFLSFKNGLPVFSRPEVQLVFVAKGSTREALVSVTYSVLGVKESLPYCGLSWSSAKGTQEFLAIVGDKSRFTATDDIKSMGKKLLSF